ncbi:MAG: Undecaprenyl-diphosphatase, partial [uncultured Acetobacteraceae bacterium]
GSRRVVLRPAHGRGGRADRVPAHLLDRAPHPDRRPDRLPRPAGQGLRDLHPARRHPGRGLDLPPDAAQPRARDAPAGAGARLRRQPPARLPARPGAGRHPARDHHRGLVQPLRGVRRADRRRDRHHPDRVAAAGADHRVRAGDRAARGAADRLRPGAGDGARHLALRRHHHHRAADRGGPAHGGRVLLHPRHPDHAGRDRFQPVQGPGGDHLRSLRPDRGGLPDRLRGGAGHGADGAGGDQPDGLRAVRVVPDRAGGADAGGAFGAL